MDGLFNSELEDRKLANLRAEEEEDVARIISEKYDLPYTDLHIVPINMDALRVVVEKDAVTAGAVAFDKVGTHLSLAITNPANPALTALVQDLNNNGLTVEQYFISHASLARALTRYADLSLASSSKEGVFQISQKTSIESAEKFSTLPKLRAYLTEAESLPQSAQVSHIFEGLLAGALVLRASDIHLEPEDGLVRLRLRLDGVLTDTFSFATHAYHQINSRIKLLSGLKLNISDRAQDGRFTVETGGKEIEIRTSIIPGSYGESIVMRILDPEATKHSFAEMGINTKLFERLKLEIHRPNGMLLTTGPTGSGKTTTLYAFMREIHTPEIKIITIEDPVEYHLEGIVQTQTNGKEYTFASGLRSVLRQDPDVIMVGEIRDAEVAEVAIQAALTGHFVFTTLHTNNASGAFPRLVDLGADPNSFSSAVTVAMAQRLVRTLDPAHRVQRGTTPEEKVVMEKIFSTLTDVSQRPQSFDTVWSAVPGDNGETGYVGRTGLHEAIFMDDELGEFLRTSPSAGDIEKNVHRQGYLTMAQDGIIKAIEGITSLEEVFKVVDLPRG
jgi:type IV pilus assembly protein PilB